jgi:GABA(A) receptor-associated protein
MERTVLKLRKQYPERVPVICTPTPNCKLPLLHNKQFLVPKDSTLGTFIYMLRQKLKITSQTGLILFINNELPPTTITFGELEKYVVKPPEGDDCLHITYSSENTFGCL